MIVAVCGDAIENEMENTAVLLHVLAKGIELNIGGKYAIGGLFDVNMTPTAHWVHRKIFDRWFTKLLPALKQQIDLMAHQPLLEASIIAKAPPNALLSIIEHFHYHDLRNGSNKRRLAINIGADFGLKWSEGMKEIVEADCIRSGSTGSHIDEESWFYPFMLAAKGEDSDLDAVFELARLTPEVVKRFG